MSLEIELYKHLDNNFDGELMLKLAIFLVVFAKNI